MTTNRRRPKSRIDSDQVRIFKCKLCRCPVTYSYNSVGRDGHKVLCDPSGIAHKYDGGSQK